MNGFSQLTKEKLGYYVYFLVDPRNNKIFYVGKGIEDRIFDHLASAGENIENSNDKSDKIEVIQDIVRSGYAVKHYIVRYALTETEAFLVESVLIDLFTHQDFSHVALLTNIMSGHHQLEYGIKPAEEIELLYNTDPLDEENLEHNLLAININKLFRKHKDSSIYDAIRKFWVLSPKKANLADYVVGEYKGIIRAIFKVNEKGWQKAEEFKNRYFFEGEEVNDTKILELYLNKKIEKIKGQANPIRYFYKK